MDQRAKRHGPADVDEAPPVAERGGSVGRRRAIDAPDRTEAVDLARVLRGVADRLDAILDDGGSTSTDAGEAARSGDAIEAWSSVITRGDADADSELRRTALATTVLRIGPDGGLDVMDEAGFEDDDAGDGDDGDGDDGDGDDGDAVATAPDAATRGEEAPVVAPAREATTPVDARLRSARERLIDRRTAVAAAAEARPAPFWRRIDVPATLRRVVVGVFIVAAAATVSVLAM